MSYIYSYSKAKLRSYGAKKHFIINSIVFNSRFNSVSLLTLLVSLLPKLGPVLPEVGYAWQSFITKWLRQQRRCFSWITCLQVYRLSNAKSLVWNKWALFAYQKAFEVTDIFSEKKKERKAFLIQDRAFHLGRRCHVTLTQIHQPYGNSFQTWRHLLNNQVHFLPPQFLSRSKSVWQRYSGPIC